MVQEVACPRGAALQAQVSFRTPLLSGQRIVDAMFLVAGGRHSPPSRAFRLGKTVMQHQPAKWSDDIVVYIGCGERATMTDAAEFPELVDPAPASPLMKRTVLIANTLTCRWLPVRRPSILASSIAEYFRDMG